MFGTNYYPSSNKRQMPLPSLQLSFIVVVSRSNKPKKEKKRKKRKKNEKKETNKEEFTPVSRHLTKVQRY